MPNENSNLVNTQNSLWTARRRVLQRLPQSGSLDDCLALSDPWLEVHRHS